MVSSDPPRAGRQLQEKNPRLGARRSHNSKQQKVLIFKKKVKQCSLITLERDACRAFPADPEL
jgi:hypothetical protein